MYQQSTLVRPTREPYIAELCVRRYRARSSMRVHACIANAWQAWNTASKSTKHKGRMTRSDNVLMYDSVGTSSAAAEQLAVARSCARRSDHHPAVMVRIARMPLRVEVSRCTSGMCSRGLVQKKILHRMQARRPHETSPRQCCHIQQRACVPATVWHTDLARSENALWSRRQRGSSVSMCRSHCCAKAARHSVR